MSKKSNLYKLSNFIGAGALLLFNSHIPMTMAQTKATLDPHNQPKFINPLPVPNVLTPDITTYPGFEYYQLGMTQFQQDLGLIDPNRGTPLMTTVWGFGGSYPGPTIEARSTSPENTVNPGTPVKVLWTNDLVSTDGTPLPHLLPLDTTLRCGATSTGIPSNCRPEVRTVTHLHGGHTDSDSDGYPEAWFSAGFAETGPAFKSQLNGVYTYRNDQEAAALWYHDHAMGVTRLNVYAGLAGFYMMRDDNEDRLVREGTLPSGPYEIPLLIQDKSFNVDGSLAYPDAPFLDPATGQPLTLDPVTGQPVPSAVPEFYGDTILVNGKAWPVLDVEPRKYRFRVLNGSNARFYKMKFEWTGVVKGKQRVNKLRFHQIGTDGGLLNTLVHASNMLLSPAERADIIVDFSDPKLAGQTIILTNKARTPFPIGVRPDRVTTGQIMAFRVIKPMDPTIPDTVLPTTLRSTPITPLTPSPGTPVRELVLVENFDPLGRLMPLLGTSAAGGLQWSDPTTETPKLGTTEIWTIINGTPDSHPIHQHMVQFQILDRQRFDVATYVPGQPQTLKLLGTPEAPESEEAGWKDTARMDPGEVTRVIATYDILGDYVWHCHILEHEDHEMMRPFSVVP